MWKTKKIVSCVSTIFNISFLAFLWSVGWTIEFWVYLAFAFLYLTNSANKLDAIEQKLEKTEK